MKSFNELNIKTYGMEIGNWYGFAGIPMGTGISSFAEIDHVQKSKDKFYFQSRVKMHRLDAKISYSQEKHNSVLSSKLLIESLSDGFIGDAVLHLTFASDYMKPRYNDRCLRKRDKYYYSTSNPSLLQINDAIQMKIDVENNIFNGPQECDLELLPYAAYLKNGSLRYHSRVLCRGQKASFILLRTRGALGCIQLGKCPIGMRRLLYRIERKKPQLFKNTQLCAVTSFPKGTQLQLRHRLEMV